MKKKVKRKDLLDLLAKVDAKPLSKEIISGLFVSKLQSIYKNPYQINNE